MHESGHELWCRARYLDVAIRHFGLSFGAAEVGELSRGLPDEADPGSTPDWDTRDPIPASHATCLFCAAQVALCQAYGLPFPGPDDDYLDVPGLGAAAVRVLLVSGAGPTCWRIERQSLDPVAAHFLCGFDPAEPGRFRLLGWASRAELLQAGTRSLVPGGPAVIEFPLDAIHTPEFHRDVP